MDQLGSAGFAQSSSLIAKPHISPYPFLDGGAKLYIMLSVP
jgi:hypothetical protein